MKKLISASEIITFLSCQKKWYYSYVEGLEPVKKSDALQIGTSVHETLPIIKSLSDNDIFENNLLALKKELDELEDEFDLEKIQKKVALKFGNIAGLTTLLKKIENKFDDCEFEVEMQKKIKNPYSKQGSSRSFILGGKIDALPKGERLFELKTLTYKGWAKMAIKLNWDLQAFIYALLTNRRIVDFIFLKKTTLRPSKKEDAIGFYERIFEDFYENYKDKLVIETNYITEKMMDEFKREIWSVTKAMQLILSKKYQPTRNIMACSILSCPYMDRCIYGGLVDVVKENKSVELVKKQKLHDELMMEDWL